MLRLRGAEPDVETCAGDVGGDVALNLLLNAMTVDQRERLEAMDQEVMQLLDSMGGSKHRYARERRGLLKKLVSDIYSPPRVTAAAKLLPSLG